MGGCGRQCRCGAGADNMTEKDVCPTPAQGITLDADGKCPCGKELKDCCHKDVAIKGAPNEALGELCMPEKGGASPCGDDEKLA